MIKSLLRNHGLIFLLLIFNIIPIITVYTTNPVIIDYHGSVTKAVMFQSIALLGILVGYKVNNIKKKNEGLSVVVRRNYFYFFSIVSLIGAYISYFNISLFTSINDLQSMIFAGEGISELRAEAGGGGLSGVFKMFSAAPLFSFLATSSLLMFFRSDNKTRKILIQTLIVSLFCTLFKVMFVFDRLSILAVLIVFVYNFFFNQSFPKIIKIVVIALLLLLVSFLTLLRMSGIGMGEFLETYFNLGVYNLEISIEKQQHFNYFFTETFFHPFSFIFKFFGLSFHSYTAENWVWNPAQSFWGFYFVDMNWLGLVIIPFLGVLIKKFETAKYCSKFWAMMYFVFAYTAFSMVTVPVFRGAEFLLMLALAYFASHKYVHFYR